MTSNAQSVSLWLAAVFGAVLLVAFVAFPGFFPPMSPQLSAAQVAAFYRANEAMIRFSMITFNFCGIMLIPLFTVVVYQLKRMATPTQVLAYCYLSATVTGATLFAISDLFWLVAAFRPDRDPALIQLLNDLAWITFTAPVGAIIAQNLTLALAIWLDDPAHPILPRWVAWFSLAVAVAIAPSAFGAMFQTGPLAWNGAVTFWLRIAAYAAYLIVMFVVLRKAIHRQYSAERPVAPVPPFTEEVPG